MSARLRRAQAPPAPHLHPCPTPSRRGRWGAHQDADAGMRGCAGALPPPPLGHMGLRPHPCVCQLVLRAGRGSAGPSGGNKLPPAHRGCPSSGPPSWSGSSGGTCPRPPRCTAAWTRSTRLSVRAVVLLLCGSQMLFPKTFPPVLRPANTAAATGVPGDPARTVSAF